MLGSSLFRPRRHTVLDVSCRVRLSSYCSFYMYFSVLYNAYVLKQTDCDDDDDYIDDM